MQQPPIYHFGHEVKEFDRNAFARLVETIVPAGWGLKNPHIFDTEATTRKYCDRILKCLNREITMGRMIDLPDENVVPLRRYTQGEYLPCNVFLRTETPPSSPSLDVINEKIASLDAAIVAMRESLQGSPLLDRYLLRWVPDTGISTLFTEMPEPFFPTFGDKGFLSSTVEESYFTQMQFVGRGNSQDETTVYVIKQRDDWTAIPLYFPRFTHVPFPPFEFLLPRGVVFRTLGFCPTRFLIQVGPKEVGSILASRVVSLFFVFLECLGEGSVSETLSMTSGKRLP